MKSVLLVEPDKVLAAVYSKALKASGLDVISVSSAQTGINMADKMSPDVIVLELMLIGHSGFEFLYELRSYKEWQSIPIIILSNVPKKEFQNNIGLMERELGIREYLYKATTSLDKLIETVESVLA